MTSAKLHVVRTPSAKSVELAGDIYASARAAGNDAERWRRMHVSSERRDALDLHQPSHKRTWSDWRRG